MLRNYSAISGWLLVSSVGTQQNKGNLITSGSNYVTINFQYHRQYCSIWCFRYRLCKRSSKVNTTVAYRFPHRQVWSAYRYAEVIPKLLQPLRVCFRISEGLQRFTTPWYCRWCFQRNSIGASNAVSVDAAIQLTLHLRCSCQSRLPDHCSTVCADNTGKC